MCLHLYGGRVLRTRLEPGSESGADLEFDREGAPASASFRV